MNAPFASNRSLGKIIGKSSFILMVCFMFFTSQSPAEIRPNIVLILADDLGFECVGANGGESYQTPVLDQLAENGMRFQHCFAQPLCTPSRVQLMTGIYNVRNYISFGVLDRAQTTFANLLKDAGYATCVAGKWQLGKEKDSPQHFGFDESLLWQQACPRVDGGGRDTRYPSPRLELNGKSSGRMRGKYGPDVVSDFICDFMERHQAEPFLAYYPMLLTHCPFCPTPQSPFWNPEGVGEKDYKGNPDCFSDMVFYMDRMVGKVIAKLDELGLRNNTLVLFVGDNGTDQPIVSVLNGRRVAGGKGLTTDAGTHVPMIASWPGVIPEGRVCEDLVDLTDFLPTICDAAGIAVPPGLKIDGKSFFPQLKEQQEDPRTWVFSWFSKSGDAEKSRIFARDKRYKLYNSGRFFDTSNDANEEVPLQDGDLDEQLIQTKNMLQDVLEIYRDARLSDVTGLSSTNSLMSSDTGR